MLCSCGAGIRVGASLPQLGALACLHVLPAPTCSSRLACRRSAGSGDQQRELRSCQVPQRLRCLRAQAVAPSLASACRGLEAMLHQRRKLLMYLRRTSFDKYAVLISRIGLKDSYGPQVGVGAAARVCYRRQPVGLAQGGACQVCPLPCQPVQLAAGSNCTRRVAGGRLVLCTIGAAAHLSHLPAAPRSSAWPACRTASPAATRACSRGGQPPAARRQSLRHEAGARQRRVGGRAASALKPCCTRPVRH